MERKIGEIFKYKGITYKTVSRKKNCEECIFVNDDCFKNDLYSARGSCSESLRSDKLNVQFKEINNGDKQQYINY